MRSLVLASLALAALSLSACNGTSSGTRDVAGTLKPAAGKTITKVVAVEPQSGVEVSSADVGAAGDFSIALAIGKRYRIVFTDGAKTVGALRFKDGSGGYTSLLPVTAPLDPTATPKDANGDGADDDVSLGDVEDADGDDQYEPSDDPLAQVDSDGDGQADSADSDDDNDGADDAADSDDDNNGVDDDSEDGDGDDDGINDEVEGSDDSGSGGSGGSGGEDSGSGGSGGSGG